MHILLVRNRDDMIRDFYFFFFPAVPYSGIPDDKTVECKSPVAENPEIILYQRCSCSSSLLTQLQSTAICCHIMRQLILINRWWRYNGSDHVIAPWIDGGECVSASTFCSPTAHNKLRKKWDDHSWMIRPAVRSLFSVSCRLPNGYPGKLLIWCHVCRPLFFSEPEERTHMVRTGLGAASGGDRWPA